MIGAQASGLRLELPSLLRPRHRTAAPQGPEGGRGKAVPAPAAFPSLLVPDCQRVLSHTCGREGTACPLSSRRAGHLPLLRGEYGGPPAGGAASGQVTQIDLRDRMTPHLD